MYCGQSSEGFLVKNRHLDFNTIPFSSRYLSMLLFSNVLLTAGNVEPG